MMPKLTAVTLSMGCVTPTLSSAMRAKGLGSAPDSILLGQPHVATHGHHQQQQRAAAAAGSSGLCQASPAAGSPGSPLSKHLSESGVTWQSSSFPFLQLLLSEQYSDFQRQPNCLQQWPRRHSVGYLI